MQKIVRLTSRDVRLLQFINEFGYCTLHHISQQFQIKSPRCYQVMQRLTQIGYIKHERIFHAQPGIYRLTSKGASYTDLPPIPRIPIGSYQHHVQLIDLSLKLINHYPEAHWISERRLKKEKYAHGVGKRGHLADGFLVFQSNKKIAIELELSLKSQVRLEQILKEYRSNFDISEVWYYCPSHIASHLAKFMDNLPHLKIHLLDGEIFHDAKK